MKDINKELNRIIEEKKKQIDKQTNSIFEQGKKEYFDNIKELSKDDFLKINEEEKNKKKETTKKSNKMRKLITLILIALAIGFVYMKFLRKNVDVKGVEFALTTTPINELVNDPREYENKEVSVSGVVTSSFNLGLKYYTLKDETGTIYVITKNAVPKEGELIKATGIFNQQFKIGDKQVETITEK